MVSCLGCILRRITSEYSNGKELLKKDGNIVISKKIRCFKTLDYWLTDKKQHSDDNICNVNRKYLFQPPK